MDHEAWQDIKAKAPAEDDGENLLMWHVYQGAMAVQREHCHDNPFFSHWMRIPKDGWIDAAQQKPGKADGDPWECVLAMHEYDGVKVTGWRQFWHDEHYTQWMKTPNPPSNYKELRTK